MNDARPIDTNGKKVLVVDDNDLILRLVARHLRDEGFAVATALGAQAAMEWCGKNGPPDLLLTDVCMPGFDGPTLYQQLCHRFSGIPVLFMSAAPGISYDHVTAPLLQKPFSRDELTSMISASLHAESDENTINKLP